MTLTQFPKGSLIDFEMLSQLRRNNQSNNQSAMTRKISGQHYVALILEEISFFPKILGGKKIKPFSKLQLLVRGLWKKAAMVAANF